MLEQVSVIGATEENVRNLLGRSPRHLSIELLKSIYDVNRGKAYRILESCHLEGRDFPALLEEMARDLMDSLSYKLLKVTEDERDSNLEFLRQIKPTLVLETTEYILEILSKIRQNVSEDLVVQTGILRIIDWYASKKE